MFQIHCLTPFYYWKLIAVLHVVVIILREKIISDLKYLNHLIFQIVWLNLMCGWNRYPQVSISPGILVFPLNHSLKIEAEMRVKGLPQLWCTVNSSSLSEWFHFVSCWDEGSVVPSFNCYQITDIENQCLIRFS